MRVRLILRQFAAVDQRLHERVVLGDLRQRAVAQQVGARIADVDQAHPAAVEQQRRGGAAHALGLGVRLDVRRDRLVADGECVGEGAGEVLARLVLVQLSQGRDHELAGDLPGRVTAHPVRERQKSGTRVGGILVVLPHHSQMGTRGVDESGRHARSSITVLPIRIGVPASTLIGVVTLDLPR